MKLRVSLIVALLAVPALVAGVAEAKGKSSGRGKDQKVSARASNEIRLNARAGVESTGKMKSTYRERIGASQVRQTFKVQVEGFAPGTELPVSVNGLFVATVIVNPLGRAEMQFTSSDNNPGDELPLPSGFPRLRAGDSVTVGGLTSTYN